VLSIYLYLLYFLFFVYFFFFFFVGVYLFVVCFVLFVFGLFWFFVRCFHMRKSLLLLNFYVFITVFFFVFVLSDYGLFYFYCALWLGIFSPFVFFFFLSFFLFFFFVYYLVFFVLLLYLLLFFLCIGQAVENVQQVDAVVSLMRINKSQIAEIQSFATEQPHPDYSPWQTCWAELMAFPLWQLQWLEHMVKRLQRV